MASKKDKILAIIGMIVFIVLCCLGGFKVGKVIMTSGLFSHYETDDITEYRNFEGHTEMESEELFGFRSMLKIFPESIKDTYKVNQYYYCCGSAGFDNKYQMVLDYELKEDEFKAEVERLSKLSAKQNGRTNTIIYDTANFSYPAYVTSFTKHSDYEYALIDEKNNRIICILSCVTDINSLPVDKKYLPKDEHAYDDVEGWYGYSMYHFYSGNDTDNSSVIMCD